MLIFQTKVLHFSTPGRHVDNFFHESKLILLSLIEKSFGTLFKFHSNLLFKTNKTKFFQSYYREFFLN